MEVQKGYHAVVWDAKQIDDQTLELTYLSTVAGFPGNLDIKVIYKLTDDKTPLILNTRRRRINLLS